MGYNRGWGVEWGCGIPEGVGGSCSYNPPPTHAQPQTPDKPHNPHLPDHSSGSFFWVGTTFSVEFSGPALFFVFCVSVYFLLFWVFCFVCFTLLEFDVAFLGVFCLVFFCVRMFYSSFT